MAHEPVIFLVAGEPSGDAIGARLMAALKEATGGKVRFAGVGGAAMEEEGLKSLFPMAELSVMGLVEVLPHARRLLRRMREVACAVDELGPDAVVTIDSPSFATGVARRIRRREIPRIHYVAPTVWAWRPWRVHKFRRRFDLLLALLPFEPEWFEAAGLACRFVGHPVVEYGVEQGDGPAFRRRHGIDPDATVVCVLPGSRRGEVGRLVEPFGAALARIARDRPGLQAVVPTLPVLGNFVRERIEHWPIPTTVVVDTAEKYDAMAASTAALAASGTVALELALAGVPCVVAYRVAPLTALVARALIRVPYANLLNLILGHEAVPELLQERCRPELLAETLERLLGPDGKAQIAALQPALAELGRGGLAPSARAAAAILDIVTGRGSSREVYANLGTTDQEHAP